MENIVRTIHDLDRTINPQHLLDATGCSQGLIVRPLVANIPRGGNGVQKVVAVEFFKIHGLSISDDELANEYEKYGLTPDPYALIAVNLSDPGFAYKHPNGAHWVDNSGQFTKWCSITFYSHNRRRCVNVLRSCKKWSDYWWIGGVRKT